MVSQALPPSQVQPPGGWLAKIFATPSWSPGDGVLRQRITSSQGASLASGSYVRCQERAEGVWSGSDKLSLR